MCASSFFLIFFLMWWNSRNNSMNLCTFETFLFPLSARLFESNKLSGILPSTLGLVQTLEVVWVSRSSTQVNSCWGFWWKWISTGFFLWWLINLLCWLQTLWQQFTKWTSSIESQQSYKCSWFVSYEHKRLISFTLVYLG